MLPSTDVLSGLLGTLYDAAGDGSRWEPFLQQLGLSLRADSAALVMHQVGEEKYVVSRSWQLNPDGARLYQKYYGSVDVWAQRGRARLASGSVCTSETLYPHEQMAQTEMYNDFLVPQHIEHGLFGILENNMTRWASVSLYRSTHLPAFDEANLEFLRILTPHMRRAFRLHFQFSDSKACRAGLGAALDMMPAGIVLLGPKGEVLFLNRAAAQLAAANDGLRASQNGLAADRHEESAQLGKLIADAAATSQGKGLRLGGATRISRRQGTQLQVLVTPVRNLPLDDLVPVCAVAFINDPSQQVRPVPEILQNLFGLTRAESRIALLLADGRTPREIAQLLSVTAHTMKSHLSSMFGKTSTSGQVQLVRLLAQLSLNLSHNDLAAC